MKTVYKRQRSKLQPSQMKLLRDMLAPNHDHDAKASAYRLGISYETYKICVFNIYNRIFPCEPERHTRVELILWAIANREEFGFELPTKEHYGNAEERR